MWTVYGSGQETELEAGVGDGVVVDVRQQAISMVAGGMKRVEAARALGVSPQTVGKWVNGAAVSAAKKNRRGSWPLNIVRMAMAMLADDVSPDVVADRLGVPRTTIIGWKRGRTPKVVYDKSRRLTVAQMRKSRRLISLRNYYRREHRFHPTLNPDYDLAPLHHLWLPRADVLAYIDSRCENTAIQLEGRPEDRLLYRVRECGPTGWARFDTVDKVFSILDLSIHELGDPVYCSRSAGPKEG